MEQIILFALLGLGPGALIAGIALGVVLWYRGSGVINLATGAVAMLAGFAFWSLKTGVYGADIPTAPSLVITFVFLVVLGLAIELVSIRPLRTASPLAKLVASLGVLLIAQASMLIAFGTSSKPQPAILPQDPVSVFGTTVPEDRFILAAIVIGAALVLAALYRWARFGLATRAAAENEVTAMFAGLSPNYLSLANTMLATIVAGGLGVLVASVVQLDTVALPLQVVPALAAALLAGFTSFTIACGAGLALGMSQSLIYYASTQSWFPTDHGVPIPGLQQLLVFLVIVITMFVRGASLPERGELVEKRLPSVPPPRPVLRPAVVGTVIAAVCLIVFPYDFRQALINTIVGIVIVLSLVVITGFVGQISVVQLALAGVAGFTLSHMGVDFGIGFPLGPLIAIGVATLLGLITAVSALRVRGVSLAVVTLAAAVAIDQFGFANSTWGGGSIGSPVQPPKVAGWDFGPASSFRGIDGNLPSATFGLFALIVAVLLCLVVARLRGTSLGRKMLAVRSNERAAAAAGISVSSVKLAAFAISAVIAGIAGVLYAYNFGSVSAGRFSAITALGLIAFAYVGGITMVSGAVFAGLIATEGLFPHALDKWLGISGNWTLLFGGVALLVTLIQNPDGVAGDIYRKRQRRLRKRSPVDAEQAAPPGSGAPSARGEVAVAQRPPSSP